MSIRSLRSSALPLSIWTLGACASAAKPPESAVAVEPSGPADASAPPRAPSDVACEWKDGRCMFWHPCGPPDAKVGEGTCWEDCRPEKCTTAP